MGSDPCDVALLAVAEGAISPRVDCPTSAAPPATAAFSFVVRFMGKTPLVVCVADAQELAPRRIGLCQGSSQADAAVYIIRYVVCGRSLGAIWVPTGAVFGVVRGLPER